MTITKARRWISYAIAAGLIAHTLIHAFDVAVLVIWQDEYFHDLGVPESRYASAWLRYLQAKALWWGVPAAIGAMLFWLVRPHRQTVIVIRDGVVQPEAR
ncbi:hypothetical protein [Azospirillum argentinense]|uniref:hypothetical protein n=1 Tax=Azospirillum argentinense TaxID=2970906 RepID=UPI0032DE8109